MQSLPSHQLILALPVPAGPSFLQRPFCPKKGGHSFEDRWAGGRAGGLRCRTVKESGGRKGQEWSSGMWTSSASRERDQWGK